jgi:hypothetical protein
MSWSIYDQETKAIVRAIHGCDIMMGSIDLLVSLWRRRFGQEILVRCTVNVRSNSLGPSVGQGLQRRATDHVCLKLYKSAIAGKQEKSSQP